MTSEEVFAQMVIDLSWMDWRERSDMALAIGLGKNTLDHWVSGYVRFPRFPNFIAAAIYMGYDLNWTWRDTPQLTLVR